MQEPSPFRTRSYEVPVHVHAAKPPLPPPNPTAAAVASANHILDYHLSTDMHAVSALCSAYAERARTVWGLCPAVILVGPNSNRGAASKFTPGVPPRPPLDTSTAAAFNDDVDLDMLVSISGVQSPVKGAAAQQHDVPFRGVLVPGMHEDVQARITAFAEEQLKTSPLADKAAGGTTPFSSTVSFCVVARSSKHALSSQPDNLESPGCALSCQC